SFKWWIIARSGGVDVPWSTAVRAYFIGMFVNCFGFGTVGGDFARGILLADGKKVKTIALASVIADRAQGLAVLSLIALISVAIFGQPLLDARLVYVLLATLFAVIAVWFIAPSIIFRIVPDNTKIGSILRHIFQVFPRSPGTVAAITLISVVFHFSQIGLHGMILHSLGADVSWPVLLTTIPFVNILATLPLSWNGLGVRENSYVFFLFPAFITRDQAVALGAMWLIMLAIASSIGGILSVLTKDFDIEAAEKELETAPSHD
ncbi:MAG: flippase-like domain-containing protein, partial [Deltaproteobacteria bacterium]|nr:flippase-like domain-containing protein [Deltaproteobacteria bacterium]